jgi:hypothetical protein
MKKSFMLAISVNIVLRVTVGIFLHKNSYMYFSCIQYARFPVVLDNFFFGEKNVKR